MDEISIGAVGAATLAGIVSILGLIIGKEQKVSEFRQAWIDDLRKCLVSYLVSINVISDALRLRKAGRAVDDAALLASYKALNEASHGITLRLNEAEAPAVTLLKAMERFESMAKSNDNLTPDSMKSVEDEFIEASRRLLKFEWKRIKKGEFTFRTTKWVVILSVLLMLAFVGYRWTPGSGVGRDAADVPHDQKIDSTRTDLIAPGNKSDVVTSPTEEATNVARGK